MKNNNNEAKQESEVKERNERIQLNSIVVYHIKTPQCTSINKIRYKVI